MKNLLLVFLIASPAFALDSSECSGTLNHLAALYEIRSLMMKSYTSSYDVQRLADRRMEALREPLPEGGYRWVQWVRPGGDGPFVKESVSVAAEQGSGVDNIEADGSQVYAVRVVVPRKRSLLHANKPVYVGTVRIAYENDGRTRERSETINQWMNPDTTRTIDLGTIASRVQVSLGASTARRNRREAVVEIHLRQAVAQDDPANPSYSAIRALQRVRESPDAATVDGEIAAIERSVFPGSGSLELLTIVGDLRRADEWMSSEKPEEQEKGTKLLKETLRRLR
ncbi:MAG TPA: hypothetical protein VMS98_05265 [Thermoanaerobaculia bacterium]|nr:hypothetical protein [Thermoanaerobaculia bacterium]